MAPAALNVVVGVNDDRYDPALHDVATAASCTTNRLAPVVQVLHEGRVSENDATVSAVVTQ